MTSERPNPSRLERAQIDTHFPEGGVPRLEELLARSHPLMVEAFRVAAIPIWYDRRIFAAIRQCDDGRDEGLIERLTRYSFILRLSSRAAGAAAFAVRSGDRAALHRGWIESEPAAYKQAHARALKAWEERPDPNLFAQDQNLVFHSLLAEYESGVTYLINRFRAYRNERQWQAADRLLAAAGEARKYLSLLASDRVPELDDLLSYLNARLAHLRARKGKERDRARQGLEALLEDPSLDERLRPYLHRAVGQAQAADGDYVQAMGTFRAAVGALDQQLASEGVPFFMTVDEIHTERAHTLIALGDAHVDLATSVGGYHEVARPGSGTGYWLRAVLHFLLSLPLAVYLSFYLGRRVWNPVFWPVLFELDWIIARLFATGARYYRQAEKELGKHAGRANILVAEEKLASLYLSMGDARAAKRRFQSLIEEEDSPLGPYRQATARLGLAESLLRLGRHEQALNRLREALPVLSRYDDLALEARAHELVGEALLAEAATDDALRHLSVASDGYQRVKSWVDATRVAERLEARLGTEIPADVQEQARQVIDGLKARLYPGRYQHPWLVGFRRAVLVALPVVLFLVPIVAIRFESSVGLDHIVSYRPQPVWAPIGKANLVKVDLSLDLARVDVYRIPGATVVLGAAVGLVLAYLAVYYLLGLAAVALTPLHTVQASGRSASVHLDDQRIALGHGPDRQLDGKGRQAREGAVVASLPWTGVTTLVKANVCFWRRPLRDASSFGLAASEHPVVIGGSTVWYSPLRERVDEILSGKPRVVDLDYSLLRSPLGALYLLSLLWVVVVGLGAALAQGKVKPPILLVDLYPYSLIFLVIAPLWWCVVQPLRRGLYLHPHSRLPLGILGIGMVLALVQVLALFRPLLTVPNLFLPLITIVLLVNSEIALWRAKVAGQRVYPAALRVVSVALAGLACLVMVLVLVRDTRAYSQLVLGNALSAQELRDGAEPTAGIEHLGGRQLKDAVDAYRRAATIASQPILGMDVTAAARRSFGVPPAEHLTQISSLTSQAILQSHMDDHEAAIATFSSTLRITNQPSQILAWLAVAELGAGTGSARDGKVEIDHDRYIWALRLLDMARQREPGRADYHLWSAVVRHSLGELDEAEDDYERALEEQTPGGSLTSRHRLQAWIGLGWVTYERGEFDRSLSLFGHAVQVDSESAAAWLGQGYALYRLERYEECLPVWEQTARLEPEDPAIFQYLLENQGALHWRLGTLCVKRSGEGCCEEYLKSTEYFQNSTDREKPWLQNDQDVASIHRMLGSMHYLIARTCPEKDNAASYAAAIDSFSKAIVLDPDEVAYWYRRGRLSHGLWLVLKDQTGGAPETGRCLKAKCLVDAISDMQRVKVMDPHGQRTPSDPPDTVIRWIRNSATTRANQLFGEGDYEQALDYYELAANSATDDTVAAFRAGLTTLHLHKDKEALAWYKEALARALATNDVQRAEMALAQLQQAQIVDPALPAGDVVALFEAEDIDPRGDTPEVAFIQALTAVMQTDFEEAAEMYSLGIELAAVAEDITAVKSAAYELRDFLLSNPELSLSEAYWSLDDDPAAREVSLVGLERPDLYWRYRAEFGFRLLVDRQLLRARPGQASDFEEVYRSIAAGIERAHDLNPEGHQVWRDFFVDAGIGWLYLRLGDDYAQEESYEEALDAYERAAGNIQPASKDAALDLTEALFKAGLTALRLGQVERAIGWYDQAMALVEQHGSDFGLHEKVGPATDDLRALVEERPDLEVEAQAILDRLQDLSPGH